MFAQADYSDIDKLAGNLEIVCPDARPIGPLLVIGQGFFSVAVKTSSDIVFRLGTHPDVFPRYEKEFRLLPWLKRIGTPTPIPQPVYLLQPSALIPYGGIGHSYIPGTPLTPSHIEHGNAKPPAEAVAKSNWKRLLDPT